MDESNLTSTPTATENTDASLTENISNNEIEKIFDEPIQNDNINTKEVNFVLELKDNASVESKQDDVVLEKDGSNVENSENINKESENNEPEEKKENGVEKETPATEETVNELSQKCTDESEDITEKNNDTLANEVEQTIQQVDETLENVKETIEKLDKSDNRAVEEIQIAELSADEETNTQDETIEYTIIEEEPTEESNAGSAYDEENETVLLVGYNSAGEGDDTEVTIEKLEVDPQTCEVYVIREEEQKKPEVKKTKKQQQQDNKDKPKKPRGRRPIRDIPLHVLGRDISKPTEGNTNGGRAMPRPRLGVKVPYRNLTSQIVSKEEIQKEIMDRFKQKQEQSTAAPGDVLFARKLTQRLAKKLIPNATKDEEPKEASKASDDAPTSTKTDIIKDNSDLIAILEGDDGEPADKEKQTEKEEFIKTVEKEIALQQLKELPLTKNRFFKSKDAKKETIQNKKQPAKDEVTPKEVTTPKQKETAVTTRQTDAKGKHVEVEPQLKADMVIKTYARKRKSFDRELSPPPPPLKKQVPDEKKPPATPSSSSSSSDVYVTKSSRIIKKKVIWDPDDSSPKTPKLEPAVKSPNSRELIKSPKNDNSKPPKLVEAIPKAEKKVEKGGESNKSNENKSPTKGATYTVKKVIVKSESNSRAGTPQKKRLTEVDRLLMDEGAVNMLYDVNNTEDSTKERIRQRAQSIISLDKVQRALISKTNIIKKDLLDQAQEQKSLRKKPATPPKRETISTPSSTNTPMRKKSKDSTRSPPLSPSFQSYSNAEASRIIRRHSSSSFSSGDEANEENGSEKSNRRKSSGPSDGPSKKKSKKSSEKKAEKANEKDVKKEEPVKMMENKDNKDNKDNEDERFKEYENLRVLKCDKVFTIIVKEVNEYLWNEEVLTELVTCLKLLEEDNDCYVVSLKSSSSGCFCRGLDYRILVSDDQEERTQKATNLASLLEQFLKCLLNYSKIIVACVQGRSVGLGVTMLPLFDMVIASDDSTFSTPYANLGCPAEGGFLLTPPYLNNSTMAFDIVFLAKVIKADEALKSGLITKLYWPEKYEEEIKKILEKISDISKQCIETNKKQLRQNLMESTDHAISALSSVLIDCWKSEDFQSNFSTLETE